MAPPGLRLLEQPPSRLSVSFLEMDVHLLHLPVSGLQFLSKCGHNSTSGWPDMLKFFPETELWP